MLLYEVFAEKVPFEDVDQSSLLLKVRPDRSELHRILSRNAMSNGGFCFFVYTNIYCTMCGVDSKGCASGDSSFHPEGLSAGEWRSARSRADVHISS